MKSMFLSLVIVLLGSVSIADQLPYPHVFFEYASSLDQQVCSGGIASQVVNELKSRLPAIQKLWNTNEAALLGAAVQLTSKTFLRHEETASLMLCPKFKGQAEPLLLPIWPFLMTTTQGHPIDNEIFLGMTFHEVLHRFVDQILGGMSPQTPLLAKYSGENILVRRHLHVDALQKAVYLQLGRSKEIEAIIASDSKFYGPDYARAWNIINSIEGERAFVSELQFYFTLAETFITRRVPQL